MNIYITFDYELFHGIKSGSVEHSLIEPTNRIEEILNKYNVKGTFFVDTTYICKLNKIKDCDAQLNESFTKICKQLKKLADNGHSIQLHIHPQWFYSEYKNGKWNVNTEYFKISSCPPKDIDKMFDEGIKLIESITNKKCIAYRAGGYSIQTLPNYAELLIKHKIKIDSSCLCGKKVLSKYQSYDFTKIKYSDIYTFNDDITLKDKHGNGRIIELPIYTMPTNNIIFAYKKTKYKGTVIKFGDGSAIANAVPFHKRIINKLKLIFTPLRLPASIDSLLGCMLIPIYRHAKRNNIKDFTIICHPKSTTNYSLKFLDDFLITTTIDNNYKTVEDII